MVGGYRESTGSKNTRVLHTIAVALTPLPLPELILASTLAHETIHLAQNVSSIRPHLEEQQEQFLKKARKVRERISKVLLGVPYIDVLLRALLTGDADILEFLKRTGLALALTTGAELLLTNTPPWLLQIGSFFEPTRKLLAYYNTEEFNPEETDPYAVSDLIELFYIVAIEEAIKQQKNKQVIPSGIEHPPRALIMRQVAWMAARRRIFKTQASPQTAPLSQILMRESGEETQQAILTQAIKIALRLSPLTNSLLRIWWPEISQQLQIAE